MTDTISTAPVLPLGNDGADRNLTETRVSLAMSSSKQADINPTVRVEFRYPPDWAGPRFFKDGEVRHLHPDQAEAFARQGILKLESETADPVRPEEPTPPEPPVSEPDEEATEAPETGTSTIEPAGDTEASEPEPPIDTTAETEVEAANDVSTAKQQSKTKSAKSAKA